MLDFAKTPAGKKFLCDVKLIAESLDRLANYVCWKEAKPELGDLTKQVAKKMGVSEEHALRVVRSTETGRTQCKTPNE